MAVGVLAGVTFYPPAFLFVVREALAFEAWKYGFHLSIGEMGGSVMEPIRLTDVKFSHNSEAGTSTLLEIDKATARFDWRHFVWKRDTRVWQGLTVDGLKGTIDLPSENEAEARLAAAAPRVRGTGKPPRLVLPASLKVSHANVVIRHYEGSVRLDDVDLEANDVEAGYLSIGALSVQEPWMTSVFSNCRGALLLEDSRLVLSDMKLTDVMTIATASADLPDLLRGHLEMEFGLNAFSGNIKGELSSGAGENAREFESDGTFANISVGQLGSFMGQDADGTINQGKFTFHGSLRELAKATFTTHFDAGNFRWGARQWKSLVAGATYVHHRLTKLDVELKQLHNTLTLDGDMSVPGNWKEWWKTDFSFAVAAQIDDLSELSALLGPEIFGDMFGKLRVDGSVRGENASFNGQLIASGSHLSFGKAPLDQLQAAVKLQGNEIQVTNAEFTHGDDFLRAHGVVNILGQKRYWGEVKANIADLAQYASFLQPPIAPEAFGGGLMLDWSGDGAAGAHSGAFTVRLNRIHPLVSGSGEGWQPLDLNAEGTYSPESIFFSNLVLGNGATTLASRVVATPNALQLQNLKLMHGKSAWLTGDAQVPLNVWAAWENPEKAVWWNFESPSKVDLKMDKLQVRDALALSGREEPYDGEITGNLKSNGTLGKLSADGRLVIKNAGAAVGDGRLRNAGGTLDFKGATMTVTSGAGVWNEMPWTGAGSITAGDLRKAAVDLYVKVPSARVDLGEGMGSIAALDLHAAGAADTMALSGTAQLQSVEIQRQPDIESLVMPGGVGLRGGLPVLEVAGSPAWKLDVSVGGRAVVTLGASGTGIAVSNTEARGNSGSIAPALMLSGSIGRPVVSGSIGVSNFNLADGRDELKVAEGVFYLDAAYAPATKLALHTIGTIGGQRVDGYITGTVSDKKTSWGVAQTPAPAATAISIPVHEVQALPFTFNAGGPEAAGMALGTGAMKTLTAPGP